MTKIRSGQPLSPKAFVVIVDRCIGWDRRRLIIFDIDIRGHIQGSWYCIGVAKSTRIRSIFDRLTEINLGTKELFSMALGLQHPWTLNNVDFIEEDGQKVLRIDIGFEKGAKFSDPDTGEPCPVHDTMERRWRHLNFFEHTCYIHCKVPRVTYSDGKVKQVDVPWARKGSGFTVLFEAYSMMLIEYEMPVNRVGKAMREYPNRICSNFDHWVGQAYEKADHSQVTQLGVDETSSRKGHRYITIWGGYGRAAGNSCHRGVRRGYD